jgi:hypothetical protein
VAGWNATGKRAKGYGGGRDTDRKEAAGCCVLVICMASFGRNYIADSTTVKLKIVCHCVTIIKQYNQQNAMRTAGYPNIIPTPGRTHKYVSF